LAGREPHELVIRDAVDEVSESFGAFSRHAGRCADGGGDERGPLAPSTLFQAAYILLKVLVIRAQGISKLTQSGGETRRRWSPANRWKPKASSLYEGEEGEGGKWSLIREVKDR